MSSNTCRYNASLVSTTGMVPATSSPLVSSGSHGSHGPSSPLSTSSTSSIPLTIGLWNANGLQESTADDLLRHCQSFSLVFITETWLLPPHRIRTSWTQFNLYGSPVINSYRGSQGVSALGVIGTSGHDG
ncbi:hypothetical protein G6F64_014608 [Rhizopus arrhizus]|uniref:Endonuclease/exonuclease/phosphatase domain-containing protein n=1 Tax=Rhizopus oryzae TaxID=64495 RepID=A0A9P6WTV4_RHIOR|nr:hypothetical protein G6F64_014608 [Rhizopus arrhizus]